MSSRLSTLGPLSNSTKHVLLQIKFVTLLSPSTESTKSPDGGRIPSGAVAGAVAAAAAVAGTAAARTATPEVASRFAVDVSSADFACTHGVVSKVE